MDSVHKGANMRIGMNQYVTISGVHPFWLNGLHAAVASPEARGKDSMPAVLLCRSHLMKHPGSYEIELECPLEYVSEEKKVYRPFGKGLMSVFTALGLYGEKEQILTGDVSPQFLGTMEVKLKVTGILPDQISRFFMFCNGSHARSQHRQRFGLLGKELHEIVYAKMEFVDWNSQFSTFTVKLLLTARQSFDGKASVLHTLPFGAPDSCLSDSRVVLVAPRSVLESIYDVLGTYFDVRNPYDYDY